MDAAAMQAEQEEAETVSLRDGRTLAYLDLGDPGGTPVVFLHGTPGSRISGRYFEEAVTRQGVRLLALDRPGYGLSTSDPTRTFATFATDVAEFADGIGLQQYAVAGWSGGGAHALGCGAFTPERVSQVVVLAGMGPYDALGADGMNSRNKWTFRMVKRTPRLFRAMWSRVNSMAMKDLEKFATRVPKRIVEADRKHYLAAKVDSVWARDWVAAQRQGVDAAVHELRLHVEPWGFEHAEVSVPVRLWHGEGDHDCPVAFGRYNAERLPDCEATFLPDEGHLFPIDRADEIFAELGRHPTQ